MHHHQSVRRNVFIFIYLSNPDTTSNVLKIYLLKIRNMKPLKPLIIIAIATTVMVIISNYFFEYVISRPMNGLLQLPLLLVYSVFVILFLIIIVKQLIKFF